MTDFSQRTFPLVRTIDHVVLQAKGATAFTPEVADASTAGNSATGTTIEGTYVRIGGIYVANINLTNLVTTSMTAGNDLYIRSLPLTALDSTAGVSLINSEFYTTSVTYTGPLLGWPTPATTYMRIRDLATGNFLKVSALTSGSADLRFSILVFV